MRPIISLLLFLFPLLGPAQNFDNGFSFYLPPDDSTTQRFLPKFPKKTADSFVTISADGHFLANGQPIRFWGVNMAYGACFPEKNDAGMIAARLRKMGINLVRFELMDSPWTGEEGTIFVTGANTTQVLNFFNLDRLHYFIAQLKAEGIYSRLVLHHARTFKEGDGVLYADSIEQTAKAVSMFDRHLIQLQKGFALQLLTPVNTYTGLSLAEDPAVAMIDITNENTLYGYWKSDWLRHQSQGGALIQRHIDTLDAQWNEFLQNKYASQTDLENTWNQTAGTGGQNEQVIDGGFESGNPAANYIMELHDVAQATLTADPVNPYEGNFSGRVDVLNATTTNWHIQFKQTGASLTVFKTYQITFAARAETDRDILIVASRDNDPYTYYSGKNISLTPDWQEFTFLFTAPENNDDNFRLGFQFNSQEGSYWFDNLSLTDAEVSGVLSGENLAAGNIARMDYSERFDFSPHRMADNTEFYLSLQTRFFDEMYAYLKNDLGVKAAINASNTWSGISDVFTARNMDFMDDQAEWDYIRYPNGWSTTDWYIENEPMVKSIGWTTIQPLFGGLAMKNKPYTISQYSHPFPNRYQVEMMPWMTAYASFQSADAVIFHYYSDSQSNWTANIVNDYHSLHRNTAQMALSPIFAFAYQQGLIAPAEQVFELEYSLPYLRALPLSDGEGRWGKYIPYDTRLAFSHGLRTAGFAGTGSPDAGQLPPSANEVATTDTEESTIDFGQGILQTETPRFISICGFMNENEVHAGALKVLAANDFGVVSWLSLTDEPLSNSSESVIVVSSKLQNSGMAWDGIQTFHDNWGLPPTEMFPMQLTLELEVAADYLQLYPLTELGEAWDFQIILPESPGHFLVNIDQLQDPTVWFGIAAMEGPLSNKEAVETGISLYPNPSSKTVFVKWPSNLHLAQIDLAAANGKTLKSWKNESKVGLQIDVADLPKGIYFLKMRSAEKVYIKKLMVD